jgi:hypothetical protein
MNDRTILTDANLEAMLARRAGKTAPAGLAESIEAALAGIPDGRRPWRSYLALPPRRTPRLRLAWVIVLVGLLMAAAVSAVFVGSQPLRHTNRLAVVPPPSVVPIPSAAPLPSAGPVATLVTPANLPPLTLAPAPGQTVTRSALGTITWRVYEADPQHWLAPVGTAHGPVTLDGPDFRWLSPSGAWDGTILPITGGWGVAAAGDDAIVYGQGAARLSWDGARWVPVRALEVPAAVGFVLRVAAGPRGTILTGGTSVAFSTDGVHFAEAVRGPVWTAPGTGASGTAGPAGIGPVLATQDGFVALVTRGPVTGRWDPLLEPRLSFSPDGSTWSLVSSTSPFGQGSYVRDVASRDGRYVAIGNVGGERGPWAVWVSDDGRSWELLPTLKRAAPCATVCADNLLAGVAAGTSGWVICSWDGAAWTSADGRVWEPLRGWPAIRGGYIPPIVALGPGVIVVSGSLPAPGPGVVVVGTIEP